MAGTFESNLILQNVLTLFIYVTTPEMELNLRFILQKMA